MCNEIEDSYDKIIITIVPSYTGKNTTRLLPLALLLMLRTHNNTDGNKLVIFSGIALYYGDTYIIVHNGMHISFGLCCRGSTCACNSVESLLLGCGNSMIVWKYKEISTVHVGACHVEQMYAWQIGQIAHHVLQWR